MKIVSLIMFASLLFPSSAFCDKNNTAKCVELSDDFNMCYSDNEEKIEKFVDKQYEKCRKKCFNKVFRTWKKSTREKVDQLNEECNEKCGDISWIRISPFCKKEISALVKNKCL